MYNIMLGRGEKIAQGTLGEVKAAMKAIDEEATMERVDFKLTMNDGVLSLYVISHWKPSTMN